MSISPKKIHHSGLTAAQVQEQRLKYGANMLTPPPREPWWKLFLSKFDDPVVRILMIAAFIAISTGIFNGHYIEGVGIVCAILLSTGLAFINEFKAGKEFDVLNKVNDEVPVQVIRDGNFVRVPKSEIVVGDIVILEVGEEVPADAEVLEAVNLQVDESKFTGESLPVGKRPEGDGEAGMSTYPRHQLLRGTMTVDGHGVSRVTSVGDATEIGKIASGAVEETGEETPLNKQLEGLSKWIGVVGFGVAVVLFAALVVRAAISTNELVLDGSQWAFTAAMGIGLAIALSKVWMPILGDFFDLIGRPVGMPKWIEEDGVKYWLKTVGLALLVSVVILAALIAAGVIRKTPDGWLPAVAAEQFLLFFMVAITIIVVAVPEGLAMSVTLSLAYSMRKMTQQNTLVRKMHACETIGAATTICSDKTGTLTWNKMKVQHAGFAPMDMGTGRGKSLEFLAEAVAANSTANLSRGENKIVETLGNPTEGALLAWLHSLDQDYLDFRDQFEVRSQLTFSTERKFMATYGRSGILNGAVVHAKGAPEVILSRCEFMNAEPSPLPLDSALREEILADLRTHQAKGMRTLGLAYKVDDHARMGADLDVDCHDMVWLGFFGIADPVREDVPDAIEICRRAGIKVKIVTGDNAETAVQIAREIGLIPEGPPGNAVMLGRDFEQASDEELGKRLDDLRVLSRARPMDKMRLVRLLQDRGEVVAVTGDGTNDAPALNYANVGLAMGMTGTAVAKEASDIILLDDSFKSITNAVLWGRSLYQNIQKFIVFQLTINVAALGIAVMGPFIGVSLPLTVTQMLWVNLIMDTFAALALATDPPKGNVMNNQPRRKDAFIVNPEMRKWVFGVGLTFIALFVAMLLFMQREGGIDAQELTLFFTIFVMLQFWNMFNARAFGASDSALKGLGGNPWFLLIAAAILAGQIIIVQFGGSVFRTVPLSAEQWILIIGLTSLVLWIGELGRLFGRMAKAGKTE